jgi:tetratricopeptide (TPR) repeat protein
MTLARKTNYGRFLAVFLLTAIVFVWGGGLLWAQIRTIRGEVKDASGTAVKDAMVEIQRIDVPRSYKTKTDKGGKYVYTGLPFGTFRIVVRKEGFFPDYIDKIQPRLGDETSFDFVLKPGEMTAKLPFEMTKEEIAKAREQSGKAEEIKKQSEEVKAFFTQGLDFASQNKFPEAIDAFQKALEKDAEQPNIWANLADAQLKNNQADKAIESYLKAIAIKPDDAGLHQNLGVIYGKVGKVKEAEASFQKAASLNPGQSAVNFYNLGATLINSGKTAEAAAAFQSAIDADPNYAEAYYQLGIVNIGLNKQAESLELMKKYLTIGKSPENLATAKALIEELGKTVKK